MCGIVASLSSQPVLETLVQGIERLEYRGYDSAGVSLITGDGLLTFKAAGKVSSVKALLEKSSTKLTQEAHLGIAHTRWATHGAPTDVNAHPHNSGDCISIVHNGIIENYLSLREMLLSNGYEFLSESDTEVLAHLIHYVSVLEPQEPLENVVLLALKEVTGAYGVCVIDSRQKEPKLIGARNGSPLILGVPTATKDGYNFMLASDTSALVGNSDKVLYLEDGDMVVCTKEGYTITHQSSAHEMQSKVCRDLVLLEQKLEKIQKGGYEHFMLKEILEQPQVLNDAMRGRVISKEVSASNSAPQYDIKLSGVESMEEAFMKCERILILGCGTSYHSAMILEYFLESLCDVSVKVEYASEFRYKATKLHPDKDVAIVISQSGETLDTLESVKKCKLANVKVFGLVNVVGSTIARLCDAGVFLRVGGEIGVASTKAFTGQVVGGYMVALDIYKRRMRQLDSARFNDMISELTRIPAIITEIIEETNLNKIKEIASVFRYAQNFLYLGRGFNYPSALEGALKLKEISYIHAEGYAAAEMKHGPIALIDRLMPVIIIAPKYSAEADTDNLLYKKTVSAVEEVRTRGGCVILVTTEGNNELDSKCEFTIKLPEVREELTPLVYAVPLQLIAYYIAKFRGCDIDQPRNLAKSVTVE